MSLTFLSTDTEKKQFHHETIPKFSQLAGDNRVF